MALGTLAVAALLGVWSTVAISRALAQKRRKKAILIGLLVTSPLLAAAGARGMALHAFAKVCDSLEVVEPETKLPKPVKAVLGRVRFAPGTEAFGAAFYLEPSLVTRLTLLNMDCGADGFRALNCRD